MPIEEPVEIALRDQLARDDGFLASAGPIMRHLVSGEDSAAFSDEIVARVRGGIGDLAGQLWTMVTGIPEPIDADIAKFNELVAALVRLPGLIGHLHAAALEWRLTEQLQVRLAFDPVLPPLLQALLASEDEATAGLSMNFLAAQARFSQIQRRMQSALFELPADLLHGVVIALRIVCGPANAQGVAAEEEIRARYDESRTRLALAARLITGMGNGAVAALAMSHAGVALFATAVGIASGQDRDVIMLSMSGSAGRFVLALRAAGLRHEAIETQLLLVDPERIVVADWDSIAPGRASELLVETPPVSGGE